MSSYLFFPMSPEPTSVSSWSTETRPTWLQESQTQDSFLGMYGADGGNGGSLQGTVAVGGGALLELVYEVLTEGDVNSLYQFWQATIVREQQRDRSAFRIYPTHCLWKLSGCPRTYQIVNALWAFNDKNLRFEHQGQGECGPLYKCALSLISVPEVVSYQ